MVDEKTKQVQAEAALNAEHFFCKFLLHHFGEKFDPLSQWRSSLRKQVYHDETMNHTLDDGYTLTMSISSCISCLIFFILPLLRCGYDFEIRDTLHLFDTPTNKKIQIKKRMCYFEVKGCAGKSNGEFHISANEVAKKDSLPTKEEA